MLDKTQGFDPLGAGGPDAHPAPTLLEAESASRPIVGIHPVVFKIALSAVAWFLAVAWLDFAGGVEVDWVLSVVTGFFVMFFTLLLVAASMIVNDRRWRQHKTSFAKFLEDDIPIDSYTIPGRDVLIQIVSLPVILAGGSTLIGLIWSIVRIGS
jgi:hypothetical protein